MPSPKLGVGICGSSQFKKKKIKKSNKQMNAVIRPALMFFSFSNPRVMVIDIMAYKATG
jgi:hypothetical protein